jgi:signal transduction histidine kinase
VKVPDIFPRALLVLAIAALPVVLLYSSLRTFQELDAQRSVYLRHRISLLAARLENVPADATLDLVREMLAENEPYLLEVRLISRNDNDHTARLEALWNGQELFRTEDRAEEPGHIFRAYVPFHSNEDLRIARIDLDPAAADFLLVHARHNVIVASVGGLALVLLSAYSVWAMRRAAKLHARQLEMERLAQLGTMAAVLAHEIRNPLGTMKGFVQLAGERADQATHQMLTPAIAEAERLERLVNDLLAYGRPPAPEPELVNWREIAANLTAHGRRLIGERPISLVIPERDSKWCSDAGLLEQILLNLVRNAVEAIPPAESGEVRVELDAGPSEVTISVLDTGPGVPAGNIARLFEPFVTTKASGTGLGLAVSRGLASSLGGDIQLRRRPAGGTAAIISLPRIAAPAAKTIG